MKGNRRRPWSAVMVVLAVAIASSPWGLPDIAVAQPNDAATEPTDASPEGMIALIKSAPKPDAKLIEALENHLSVTELPAEAAKTVGVALDQTTLDSDTLFKLLSLIGKGEQQDAVGYATMAALARQIPKDVADNAQVAPICRAILKTQPIMSKIAWRRDSGRLKTYGDVLAVYVDHCPKGDEAFVAKLADIQIRHITAARFSLDTETALTRVNAIDPAKLTREKDRDQLNYLKTELYVKAKQPEKAGPFAKAVWENPNSEFRFAGWEPYFEWLRLDGKITEAGQLLDQVAATGDTSSDLAKCRQRLAETAATQPATP